MKSDIISLVNNYSIICTERLWYRFKNCAGARAIISGFAFHIEFTPYAISHTEEVENVGACKEHLTEAAHAACKAWIAYFEANEEQIAKELNTKEVS